MRHSRTCAALLAGVVLLVAGCGGGSEAENDYVKALNASQTGLAQRFTALQDRITATSTPAQDERTLVGYETAVRDAVGRLRAIDPPDGLDALHRRFVGDIADYGSEVRRAREALAAGRPQDALAAQRRLTTAVGQIGTRINATIKAINDELGG